MVKNASGKKILVLNKQDWQTIGKTAGWIKSSKKKEEPEKKDKKKEEPEKKDDEAKSDTSGASSGDSDVRSPTSTETSTDAYTSGNVTVTGGKVIQQ